MFLQVLSPAKTNVVEWMQANGKLYGHRLWVSFPSVAAL